MQKALEIHFKGIRAELLKSKLRKEAVRLLKKAMSEHLRTAFQYSFSHPDFNCRLWNYTRSTAMLV